MLVRSPLTSANFLLLIALVGRAAVPEGTRSVIDGIMKQKGSYVADEGVYKCVLPREAAIIVQDYESMSPNWASLPGSRFHLQSTKRLSSQVSCSFFRMRSIPS